jgi:hypothetical protein
MLRKTLVHAVWERVAAIKAGSAKLFNALIAREATEDDLPAPAYLATHSGDSRASS